jgi:hypothetical protein
LHGAAPYSGDARRRTFDNFVIRETHQHPQRSLTFAFIVRKAFNQPSLLLRTPRAGLEPALHGFWGASDLALQLRLLSPNAPEVLVGMLDEDRRDNAKGGLAADRQPSYGCRPSPCGRASCRRVVRRNSARQARSQHFRFALHASGFDPSSLFLRPRRHWSDFSCGL